MLKGREIKKAFYGVIENGETEFTRMKYFTELSISKNPIEYSRRYVDEKTERSDVVGYAPSISYSFDEYLGDAVLEDFVKISDMELVGGETHRDIVLVDFSKEVLGGFSAVKRTFAIIPDTEGDSTDAYTYSGSLKAVGDIVAGVATILSPEGASPEKAETIIFSEEAM